MDSEPKTNADAQSAVAIESATVHAEAVETARKAQLEEAVLVSDERISNIVSSSLIAYFNHGAKENKFIDVGRIPFICDDLHSIHNNLEKMATNATWTKWIAITMSSVIGPIFLSVLGWMLLKIINNSTQIAVLIHNLSK